MSSILGIVPARGGSKGIPEKNIKLLGGKPLLVYTIEKALEAKLLNRAILSTDNEEIAKIGINAGIEVPFLRPHNLATDLTPTIEVVKHALNFYSAKNILFDGVCILQPTSPFRPSGFIDNAIKKFEDINADSLVSVVPIPHFYNPHWVFFRNKNFLQLATGDKMIIPRRQDLPEAFIRDGSIYITQSTIIVNTNSLYGTNITYIISDPEFYVNIDTIEDWEKAEFMTKTFLSKNGPK